MILNGEHPGVFFSGAGSDGTSGNQGGKGGLGGERPKAENLVEEPESQPEPDGSSGTKNPNKTSTALGGSRPRGAAAEVEAPEPGADH
jgi:hypothetical protein